MTAAHASNEEIRRRVDRRQGGPFQPAPAQFGTVRERILDTVYGLVDHAVTGAARDQVHGQVRWLLLDSGTVIALGAREITLGTHLDRALPHGIAEVVVDLDAPLHECALRVGRDAHGDLAVTDTDGQHPDELL